MIQRSLFCLACRVALVALAILAAGLACSARQQGETPAGASQAIEERTLPAQKQDAKPPEPATSRDRLFYAMPNFMTVREVDGLPPLTSAEKFSVVARGSFDYFQGVWYGALAGISQAENSEPSFGQEAQGYGKRYGTAVADGTIEDFMTGAILPSVLHQDPRFFQSGQGGFWRRTGYAISRIFVTRGDSGRRQFNFSEVVGSGLAAGISTYSYHPRADRTFSNTASVWGTQIGYDALTIVVKEFWPDIRRKMSRKSRLAADAESR